MVSCVFLWKDCSAGIIFRLNLTVETYVSKLNQWLPQICLLLAMILWASSFVAMKLALEGYHPMQVVFGRMLIATLCFAIFIRSFRRLTFRRNDMKYLLLMAFCEPCLYFLFEARALELTSASQAGMVSAILPLLVAVLAWSLLKEQIRRQTLVGFAVAVVGVIWLSLAGDSSDNAPNPLLGNFLEFLAMICAAGYTISVKHLSSYYPPLFLTAFQAFIGSLFFFPFLLLPGAGLPASWVTVPALAVIYLGVAISCLAYGCYNFGVSKIPANRAAAYVNLIPVFAVIMGMIILGDKLNMSQLFACILVFFGVWLSSRKAPLTNLRPAKVV
jgi:drug/metabolite transporter (DMT)-like permease